MSKNIYIGMDFGSGPSQTVWAIYIDGIFVGTGTFQSYKPDLLSKHLIRRLAAEAIITISLNS